MGAIRLGETPGTDGMETAAPAEVKARDRRCRPVLQPRRWPTKTRLALRELLQRQSH